MKDFNLYRKALTFAFKHYNVQKRENDILYIVHPIRVCTILRSYGYSEITHSEMLISALFHDLIEDTEISKEDIKKEFDSNIAQIVHELSKKENETKKEYLKSLRYGSKEAKIIKMADRIDNLLDLEGTTWKREEKIDYANQGKIILEICGKEDKALSKKLSEVINNILDNLMVG